MIYYYQIATPSRRAVLDLLIENIFAENSMENLSTFDIFIRAPFFYDSNAMTYIINDIDRGLLFKFMEKQNLPFFSTDNTTLLKHIGTDFNDICDSKELEYLQECSKFKKEQFNFVKAIDRFLESYKKAVKFNIINNYAIEEAYVYYLGEHLTIHEILIRAPFFYDCYNMTSIINDVDRYLLLEFMEISKLPFFSTDNITLLNYINSELFQDICDPRELEYLKEYSEIYIK
jgi:hypothetical protein